MTVRPLPERWLDPEAKYVVLKATDFLSLAEEAPGVAELLYGNAIPDAVVIRLQDIFAGPGLAAYANAVQTFIEAVDALATAQVHEEYIERMEVLRDFFMSKAQEAFELSVKKVPD